MTRWMWLLTALALVAPRATAQDVTRSYGRPTGPSVGGAQDLSRLFTRPALLPQEILDRLNLLMAWHVYVPTDGRRDGIFSVQVLGSEVLVQTRSGMVTLLDANDGSVLWRVSPGIPYRVNFLLGYNAHSVFAIRGLTLYGLDRQTGQEQWQFLLPHGPSAAPVADDERIYLCLGTGKFFGYELPGPEQKKPPAAEVEISRQTQLSPYERGFYSPLAVRRRPASAIGPHSTATEAVQQSVTGPQPQLLYTYLAGKTRLEQAPLLTQDLVVLAGTDGSFFALSKYDGKVLYEHRALADVTAPLGQHGNMAYVASQDYNLYALDILAGQIVWRFTGATPILRKPAVIDDDVYLVPDRGGLYRIDRASGDDRWRNVDAVRWLAANPKFVYAMDRHNRLLILERASGTQLAVLDTRDYVVDISNETTDRVFLAANDGLLVCLHDREYKTPLVMKKVKVEKKAEEAPGKPPAAKPEELEK